MRKTTIATLLAALALASCGGDDDSADESSAAEGNGAGTTEMTAPETSAGGGGATRLKLVADPGGALEFDKTELTAKPGRVTVVMDNPSDVPHAVEIEGGGVEAETETVTGASSRVSVELEPGEYKFYCPVGNHAQAGMEGSLTVR